MMTINQKQLLLTLLLFIPFLSNAQKTAKNSLYLEAGGNAGIYSISYDRFIKMSSRLSVAPRIGVGWTGGGRFAIPVEANLLLSKPNSKHYFELGPGIAMFTGASKKTNDYKFTTAEEDSEKGFSTRATLRLGYRHQKPEGGLMYRAGLLGLFNPNATENKVIPWLGFGLG